MRCATLWIVVALCLARPAEAAGATVEVAAGTATLEIPETWVSLPTHTLRMQAVFGPGSEEYLSMAHWTDAFRPGNDVESQPVPAIVVEVYETGRLSWSDFAASVKAAEQHRAVAGQATEPLARSLLESTWDLDPNLHRLSVESVFDTDARGPLVISSVTELTDVGTISVHGLTTIDAPEEYLDIIDRIHQSLVVDPSVAYRWKPSDLVDALDQVDLRLRLVLSAALVCGGLLIGIRVYRRWTRTT